MPPRCLFPERKDTGGDDFRLNLITVPSCDPHNLGKFKDDEFLMAVLAAIVGNNSLAYQHLTSKVTRAMELSEFRLLKAIIKKPRSVFAADSDGVAMPAKIGKADLPRLHSIFEAIAFGLYYVENETRFTGCKIVVFPTFVTYLSDSAEEATGERLKRVVEGLLRKEGLEAWPRKGSNPKVLYYQVGAPDQSGCFLMGLCFFGVSEVLCSFVP